MLYQLDILAGVIKYKEVFEISAGKWGRVFRGINYIETIAELLDIGFNIYGRALTKEELLFAVEKYTSEKEISSDEADILREIVDVLDTKISMETMIMEVIEFIRKKRMKEAMMKLVSEDISANDIIKKLQHIFTEDDTFLNQHTGNYLEYTNIEERLEVWRKSLENNTYISTGIKRLDEYLSGGIKKGGLNIIMGPTGAGKTAGLIHFSKMAVCQKFNTIYISLELSEQEISTRFDMAFLKKTEKYVKNKDTFERAFKTFLDANNLGTLIIANYPPYSRCVFELRELTKRLASKYDTKIDMVVIDYGDLIRSNREFEARRYELAEIFGALKRWAVEENIWMLTATQANRQALEKEYVSLSNVSEAISKMEVADVVIGVLQGKQEKQAHISLIKNRYGPIGIRFIITQNLKKMQFIGDIEEVKVGIDDDFLTTDLGDK